MAEETPSSVNDNTDKILEKRPLNPKYSIPKTSLKILREINETKRVANCTITLTTIFLTELFNLELWLKLSLLFQ